MKMRKKSKRERERERERSVSLWLVELGFFLVLLLLFSVQNGTRKKREKTDLPSVKERGVAAVG